jgi:hypothetical protein
MTDKPFQWPGQRAGDPAHDMLVSFLVMDIQHNLEWALELRDRIEDVTAGKIPEWERIGNAFQIGITVKGALIEDLVDEDSPARGVSLVDMNRAVNAWIETIQVETK